MIPMHELRMLLPATKLNPDYPEADVVSQEAH
jgi:hypothetical protein